MLSRLWKKLMNAAKPSELKTKIEDVMAKAKPNPFTDPAIPMAIGSDGRVEIEFYCQICDSYLYIPLNLRLNGNHKVNCPCGHEHYRVVKDGIITSDRFHAGHDIADDIIVMASARVPAAQRRQRGNIAVLRELEACGVLK